MKIYLQIIATYNDTVIAKHLIKVRPNGHSFIDDTDITMNEHQCCRMTRSYSLSQLICFMRKLTSFDDYYKLLVFNFLKSTHKAINVTECERNKSKIVCATITLTRLDHVLNIDSQWNSAILKLVTIRFQIEESLAWLSTLGGAYSSLGEHNVHCALKAGRISLSQLRLASVCGDPNIIARCGIYMGFSLCQRGQQRKTRDLIKSILYPYISNIVNRDNILKNMYSALCYRVKHISKYK